MIGIILPIKFVWIWINNCSSFKVLCVSFCCCSFCFVLSTTADVRRYSVRGEETVNPMLMQAAPSPSPDSDSIMTKSTGTDSACSNEIPAPVFIPLLLLLPFATITFSEIYINC